MGGHGESSIPPPCVNEWYYVRNKKDGVKKEKCNTEGTNEQHENTVGFFTKFMDYIHKKYSAKMSKRSRREWARDMISDRPSAPTLTRSNIMIPEEGEEWWREGDEDGNDDF
ncbi:uncharacterized protein V6R79_002873 [Siganus canaliculatus]